MLRSLKVTRRGRPPRRPRPLLPGLALALAAVLAAASGCGFASAPLPEKPHVVATPQNGDLEVTTEPGTPVGNVLPVYVSIANGTDVPRAVVPSQIFAIDENGGRVAPIPPAEAAREAGGAKELTGALESAAVSGVGAGVLGAGAGALAGAVAGGIGKATAIGGAIGAGWGAFQGASAGANAARRDANQQIGAVALHDGEVRKDFTVSGYVFFPNGDYREIQVLLINQESGFTETITRPLH